MANELSTISSDNGKKLCTIDLASTEGKLKALEIIGGNSVAGKDYYVPNKPTVMLVKDILLEWRDEWTTKQGEILPAGYRATCVLASGDLVHFSSWRVVSYLRACLTMWGERWPGITLKITLVECPGNTSYRIEYVREGIGGA